MAAGAAQGATGAAGAGDVDAASAAGAADGATGSGTGSSSIGIPAQPGMASQEKAADGRYSGTYYFKGYKRA